MGRGIIKSNGRRVLMLASFDEKGFVIDRPGRMMVTVEPISILLPVFSGQVMTSQATFAPHE
jgi:hypothetical protein